nr:immunoglobulin light chain junction region [Macaca mulatta]MOV76003.1 immunoglobulin light chain junction region [Macaca mulatta]
CMQNLEFPYSF